MWEGEREREGRRDEKHYELRPRASTPTMYLQQVVRREGFPVRKGKLPAFGPVVAPGALVPVVDVWIVSRPDGEVYPMLICIDNFNAD